ncbi:unnamed protein product [Closterium sp. Naga37s-1]|nr:unnamed protein product [Closterium sp. Naga37s-1]
MHSPLGSLPLSSCLSLTRAFNLLDLRFPALCPFRLPVPTLPCFSPFFVAFQFHSPFASRLIPPIVVDSRSSAHPLHPFSPVLSLLSLSPPHSYSTPMQSRPPSPLSRPLPCPALSPVPPSPLPCPLLCPALSPAPPSPLPRPLPCPALSPAPPSPLPRPLPCPALSPVPPSPLPRPLPCPALSPAPPSPLPRPLPCPALSAVPALSSVCLPAAQRLLLRTTSRPLSSSRTNPPTLFHHLPLPLFFCTKHKCVLAAIINLCLHHSFTHLPAHTATPQTPHGSFPASLSHSLPTPLLPHVSPAAVASSRVRVVGGRLHVQELGHVALPAQYSHS